MTSQIPKRSGRQWNLFFTDKVKTKPKITFYHKKSCLPASSRENNFRKK